MLDQRHLRWELTCRSTTSAAGTKHSGNGTPAGPAASNAALASRFHQMFPVLSETEIDRVRRFGEVRRFAAGELLFHAGEAVPGMYVILSGRIAIVPRDALGQAMPVAAFAELIGAPLEEMTEVVPGEVIADIGQLSGRPDLSAIDARAIGDVEAIVVPPEGLRALLVAEAELGERILRALILRRVALIELGFGGPVLVGALKSPDVTRLSHFLERNAIPFRVVDPDEDRDASALLARLAADGGRAPNRRSAGRHGAQEPDQAGAGSGPGPGGDELPLRTVRRGHRRRGSGRACDRGLRAHRRASPSWCWKRLRLEGRRAPARASRTIWVFRLASRGRR